jgi:hypothetical protein
MNKKVNIMGGEDFKPTGMFFYCACDDIKALDKDEILNWFGDAKKIILENGSEFNIMSIGPMISFTNIGTALIKVDTENIPMGIYPITATIS